MSRTVIFILGNSIILHMERLKKMKIPVQLMTTAYLSTLESSLLGTWRHVDLVQLSAFYKID